MGLEIYAYYKPYETGMMTFPEGSTEAAMYGRLGRIGGRIAWVNPFVADHPHLRIKRREDDLPPDLTGEDHRYNQTAQARRLTHPDHP